MDSQNQRIQLNLHKYKTAGVPQYNIDLSSDEELDDQSSLSSVSEDDFSDSESGSYQDTTVSTPSEATTDEMLWGRRRAPVCGIAGVAARRQLLMNQQPRDTKVLGNNKQVFQSYVPNTPSSSDRAPRDMYSQIRRGDGASFKPREKFIPPRRPRMGHGSSRDLSAIEEMSPIRSSNYSSDSEGGQRLSLRAQMEWKPQLTSTTTSFQALNMVPQTPKTPQFKTPLSPVCSSTPQSQRLYRKNPKQTRYHSSALALLDSHMESSLNKKSSRRAISPDPWLVEDQENESPSLSPEPVRPMTKSAEDFGLNNAFAKHKDIRGILFLGMSLCGRRLKLHIQDAAYFRDSHQPYAASTYIEAKLLHKSSSKSASSRKTAIQSEQRFRTRTVNDNNSPSFEESFKFSFAENCARDIIIITVFEVDPRNQERKRFLGGMTFPVSRILKKANQMFGDTFQINHRRQPIEESEISNEGFFLLNKDQGGKQNFPQRKVRRQTYYEDPAFTGMSSSAGSSTVSNHHLEQMMATSARLSVPNELTMGEYYCSSSNDMQIRSTNNLLDYTSASSSTNGSSEIAEKLKFHRATLPSITTTSDNNSDDAKSLSPERTPINHKFLCADDNGGVYGAGPTHSAIQKTSIRRAASFTFSPTPKSKNREEKKRFFGPLSRTLSYLRSKMDLALSTSTLYPTREEVRKWEKSFDSLLSNKFGCALFHQFLKKEFSDENMEFWLQCEEFKKMKDGKKSTQKAFDIYNEYVVEQSPKEINLDNDTRAATRAAVEGGCKIDTFDLAQVFIEQLMAKDSYTRFLRDRLYLDMLESYDSKEKDTKEKDSKEREPSSSLHSRN